MTYELCKKLKDAGFPQIFDEGTGFYEKDGGSLFYVGNCDNSLYTSGCGCCASSYEPDVRAPTLLELINACGDGIIALQKEMSEHNGGYEWCAVQEWEAYYPPSVSVGSYGGTPEEAVANLWLALNEK
jgi:hypothetical protein